MMRSAQVNICGYCNACVRIRINVAQGRCPGPLECAYKHILESFAERNETLETLPETPRPACASCRWTSDAQFLETPPSSSDLSLEWSSQSSSRPRIRRRKK